jgi:hypothetical protein
MIDAARLRPMLEHLADAEAMLGEFRPWRFRTLLVQGNAEVVGHRLVEVLTGEHLRDLVTFRAELTEHIAT